MYTYEETVDYIKEYFQYLRDDLKKFTYSQRIDLHDLNKEMEQLYYDTGLKLKDFREVIKDLGICLRNCVCYGSQERLRKVILESKKSKSGRSSLTIHKEDAKRFFYVKSCLIELVIRSRRRRNY